MNSSLLQEQGSGRSVPDLQGSAPRSSCKNLVIEARRDRERWHAADPEERSACLTQSGENLRKIHNRAERRLEKGIPVSDSELWIVEHRRLLESVVKDLKQDLKERGRLRRRDERRRSIAFEAAVSYLTASHNVFDRPTVVAYFRAAQEDRPWPWHDVRSLKSALRLRLLERLAKNASFLLSKTVPSSVQSEIRTCFLSLIRIDHADWRELNESLSGTETVLSRDPAGAYCRMDFETKERYRLAAGELARGSDWTEEAVVEKAISLAAEARRMPASDLRATERRSHVGYYLIDDGRDELEKAIRWRSLFRQRLTRHVLRRSTGYYLGLIEMVTLGLLVLLVSGTGARDPVWILGLLLLLPALDSAIAIANRLVSIYFPPRVPPKLDFSGGVPADCKTLVVVPTMLLNEEQVADTVNRLEIRFWANRDANIAFALLTDVPDSDREVDERDRLADSCAERVRALNRRCAPKGTGPFYLLHRRRVYNEHQRVWMGWERKRGKLLELNQFLLGRSDAFPVKVGDLEGLRDIRYVITLDSDTQLPKDAARRMIGAMAHPLNRPVIDPTTGIVREGYAILQPRVGISVQSASRSRLAAVFSGETGFDVYTRAISETYQDLFGEGIFTGKGIYELETFDKVISDRFPTNALLSHDLIEGVHARTGLSSDIEVIDDYPSRFTAYVKRKHRWVRGDWQILRWLFPRAPAAHGELVRNPLSSISKWKILDNLRRSLLDAAIFTLLIYGWLFLPGQPLYWTVAVLILFALPGYMELAFTLARLGSARHPGVVLRRSAESFADSQMHVFLFLAFLPYQTLVMIDAIVRTIRRMFITKRNLLEWQTAAQVEMGSRERTPIDRYLDASLWVALGVGVLLALKTPATFVVAAPLLVLWALAKPMCEWLDRAPRPSHQEDPLQGERFLRDAALLQWRFFRENSNRQNNWLIPDSVQESPAITVHRTSPTNIGLLLNAQLSAVELGYATLPEAVGRIEATLRTIEGLERCHGHLLNWYDTQTRQPAPPFFISTVDNGNLAASLWALKQGLLELLDRPPILPALKKGLTDHFRRFCSASGQDKRDNQTGHLASKLQAAVETWDSCRGDGVDPFKKMAVLIQKMEAKEAKAQAGAFWRGELMNRIARLRQAARALSPWLLPEVRGKLASAGIRLHADAGSTSLARTPAVAKALAEEADCCGAGPELIAMLRRCNREAAALVRRIQDLAVRADALVREMDFGFLLNRERKLLAVGYDVAAQRPTSSCYDLLASEARTAVFVALAKGDIPQESWLRLGRAHFRVDDRCVLASWTGTLFEYLMPLLWMRSYPNTLIHRSARAAVEIQRQSAARKGVPWGVSEAAYGARDAQGQYQYHAFGLPALALCQTRPPERLPRWVVAPYASFLALQIDLGAALKNLEKIRKHGWTGRYGFYESVEFDGSSGSETGRPVRSWMAHHQAMALIAICNVLNGHPFRRWFHAEPSVAAAELLLHERSQPELALEAERRAA